jgi:trans-AT polyketide synthase/acyltransferase/oxidoreductase domain-containing protein
MGAELFDDFRDMVEEANAVLGYSIQQLCLKDLVRLNQTEYTQPALYVVCVLSYLKKVRQTGVQPACAAGHGVGEYTALFAARAFDFVAGLKLVKKRGELMAQAKNGGMAAILSVPINVIENILRKSEFSNLDIANLNAPLQAVISGPIDDIRSAGQHFIAEGGKYIVLNVTGASNSRYMSQAKEEFKKYLWTFSFGRLRMPVISNCTGRPYWNTAIWENLANQLTATVQWVDTMRYLSAIPDATIEEVGSGTTLTGLLRQFQQSNTVTLCSPMRPCETVSEVSSPARV